MVTQKQIAELAGVSRATVSRVFTQNAYVHPKTVRKVQIAAQQLGGTFPDFRRKESEKKSYVMVITGDASDEFYSRIIKGCCNVLSKHQIFTVVCDSNYDIGYELECIDHASDEKYSGIVLITAVDNKDLISRLRTTSVPVVLANRYIHALDMDMVCVDNYNGGYFATHYLIDKGHKNIAFLGGFENSSAMQDRYKGYCDAFSDAGLAVKSELVYFSNQVINDGKLFAKKLIEKESGITALFSANCPLAVGAVNTFIESGKSVPDDISVICFDDSPLIGEEGLNLTTVSYDPYLIGQETAHALLRTYDDENRGRTTLLLSPRLIERTSVRSI